MTIDAATLPRTEAGATLNRGQLFTVRGSGFANWPDEIVLGYAEGNVLNSDEAVRNLPLESKTDTELVFKVVEPFTYQQEHTWGIFGTPTLAPRSILNYTTM